MAILEKSTGNYYKIIYEECMVKGNDVIVAYEVYKTANERDKDKSREQEVKDFIVATQIKVSDLHRQIMTEIEALGLEPPDVLSQTETDKIDKDKYPALRAIQDEMNGLENLMHEVGSKIYAVGIEQIEALATKATARSASKTVAATESGFNQEWIDDPVCITGRMLFNVGQYNGEPITREFYYNRLKKFMNDSIEDC